MKKNKEENELSEIWKEFRSAKAERRAQFRESETKKLLKLKDLGHTVVPLTPYQFRIDGFLDVFPTSRKYHDILKNERGQYENIFQLVEKCKIRLKITRRITYGKIVAIENNGNYASNKKRGMVPSIRAQDKKPAEDDPQGIGTRIPKNEERQFDNGIPID